ncbi:MAG: hypothetical protein KGL39_00525 [Patescibacteria group bacterium]|nr:hypothetical protein [Patescibacteria group bacterium]
MEEIVSKQGAILACTMICQFLESQGMSECAGTIMELLSYLEKSDSMLSFRKLRVQNVKRCQVVFHPNGSMNDWTPSDWAVAMAGECGECCNEIKKLRRLATAPEAQTAMHPDDQRNYAQRVVSVGEELADLLIYADLLAARLGIDLEDAVRKKFNAVSEKNNCDIRL